MGMMIRVGLIFVIVIRQQRDCDYVSIYSSIVNSC